MEENKYRQMWEELEKGIKKYIPTVNPNVCTEGHYSFYAEGQKSMQDRYEYLIEGIKKKYFPKPKKPEVLEGIKKIIVPEEEVKHLKGREFTEEDIKEELNCLYDLNIGRVIRFSKSENSFDKVEIYYQERSKNNNGK